MAMERVGVNNITHSFASNFFLPFKFIFPIFGLTRNECLACLHRFLYGVWRITWSIVFMLDRLLFLLFFVLLIKMIDLENRWFCATSKSRSKTRSIHQVRFSPLRFRNFDWQRIKFHNRVSKWNGAKIGYQSKWHSWKTTCMLRRMANLWP